MRKKWLIKLLIILLLAAIMALPPVWHVVKQAVVLLSSMDVEQVRQYILSFGIWAPVVSFLLMVFQSVAAPLPAFLITFANAALFGWIWGAVLSWSSAMVGALVCFYIARALGRQGVEKFTSKAALESADVFFERYGKHTILIARLLPFVSFDLVSYAAGLTSMRLSAFLIATGIGQLPATLVYSYIGGMLTGGVKWAVMALLCLFALSVLVIALKKYIGIKKATLQNDKNHPQVAFEGSGDKSQIDKSELS